MERYTLEDGLEFMKAARGSIELAVRSPRFSREMVERQLKNYDEKRDVVVRIIHYPTGTVRGSSMMFGQEKRLMTAIMDAALSASYFTALGVQELSEMVIEVSVLFEPEQLHGSYITRRNSIEVGRDGIIIEYGSKRSVLLPQYAKERNLTKISFLEAACRAIGLPKDYWMQSNVRLYKFEAQTFIEESPNGELRALQ